MRKIYTRTVFEFDKKADKFVINQAESEFHLIADDAPITEMKGGGSNRVTNITKSDPWAGQQPYLASGFRAVSDEFLQKPPAPYYPGQTVADFSPETMEAQTGILNRARAGSPLNTANANMLQGTLRGDYLYGGQGFNAALDAAKNKIIPQVQSSFAARGRTGSGLAQQAEASAIGDSFAKLYGEERGNQMRAGYLAPQVANQDYADLERVGAVGRERELMNQSKIDADMSRYDYNQNSRKNAIMQYLSAISGSYGGTSTSMAPNQGLQGWQRYLAGALGGAGSGFAAGGPWGAAAGAGLGLLGAYQ